MTTPTQFRYHGLDRDSVRVEGQLQAEDISGASRALIARGVTPIAIEPSRSAVGGSPLSVRKVSTKREVQVLLEELATLLQAGVPLAEALPSLSHSYSGHPLGHVLTRVDQQVRSGSQLSDALREHPLPWPSYVLALMQAGEASGQMGVALKQAADQIAHELKTAQELRSALIYPAILVFAGMVAVLVVFVGVIPRFAGLLKGTKSQLPEFSRMTIEFGVFLQQHLMWLGWGSMALVALIYWATTQHSVRNSILSMISSWPLVGPWFRSVEVGRWSMVLGTLLSNRVPFLDAIRLSSETMLLEGYRNAVLGAIAQLQRGGTLSQYLDSEPWFPRNRLNLIRVGEGTGELPRLLRTLGEIETQSARVLQSRVLTILEPVAIVVIGAVIAIIMISVMTAVTSLNSLAL